MIRLLGMGLMSIGMFALVVRAADTKEEWKPLQGTWRPKSGEMAGKAMATEGLKSIKLVIADDKYTVGIDRGTIKIDATRKPSTMDIIGVEGPNKGKTFLAIYEVTGDTLKICYDLAGKTRPTEFKTTTGTMQFMLTYERDKQP